MLWSIDVCIEKIETQMETGSMAHVVVDRRYVEQEMYTGKRVLESRHGQSTSG